MFNRTWEYAARLVFQKCNDFFVSVYSRPGVQLVGDAAVGNRADQLPARAPSKSSR